MATYAEIASIFGHDSLRNRVQVACVVAGDKIVKEDAQTVNHANRLTWAKRAFSSSRSVAENILPYLLAAYREAPLQNIIDASDEDIQAAVDAVVNIFATGE
jgi:hypothetical protein